MPPTFTFVVPTVGGVSGRCAKVQLIVCGSTRYEPNDWCMIPARLSAVEPRRSVFCVLSQNWIVEGKDAVEASSMRIELRVFRSCIAVTAATLDEPLLDVPEAGSSFGSITLVGWMRRPLAESVTSPKWP